MAANEHSCAELESVVAPSLLESVFLFCSLDSVSAEFDPKFDAVLVDSFCVAPNSSSLEA